MKGEQRVSQLGMVIVGAGEAGARAAIELRNQGWNGPITVIGKEEKAPYERPPLSKNVLTADSEPSPTFTLDEEKLTRHSIKFLSGSCAVGIKRQDHIVMLEGGQEVRYERLLLATGANPRKLSIEGSDTTGALYLRTFSGALKIRSHLYPGKHIVVIGGGFIGLEVAASARQRGCFVTLVEAGPRILMRGVPEEIAKIVEARHRTAGVELKLGAAINRIESRSEDDRLIMLADGNVIRCDAIIIGIGALPETSLAAQCGLRIENGVWADETLATSDPDIFAAGDCCSFPHALYDGKRIRLEAWRNAQDQGILAARNMAGASERYESVPWFWSDQYEQTLQVAGLPDCGEITAKRQMDEENHLYFHFAGDGRLVAASGIGSSITKDMRIAEMLIEQMAKFDPGVVMNPGFKLKSLLQRGV